MIGLLMALATSSVVSGNDLYTACKSSEPVDQAYCMGFVSGVVAGAATDRVLSHRPPAWCMRDGVTNGQLVAVTIKFMDDDPSIRDQDAAGIIEFAMVGAFPCPKQ
jgi:hypothetical protein